MLALVPFDRPLIWSCEHKFHPIELNGGQRNQPCVHDMFWQFGSRAGEESGPDFCRSESHLGKPCFGAWNGGRRTYRRVVDKSTLARANQQPSHLRYVMSGV